MRTVAVGILMGLVVGAASQGQQGVPLPVAAATATVPAADVRAMREMLADWPQLGRYRAENAALAAPKAGEQRVVFFGSSTTDNWGRKYGSVFFPGRPYVNRGIGGQTTPQMLVRFQQDVVALHPAAVVILAGTNDVAGNTGPSTVEMAEDCLRSMVSIAEANGIKVIFGSQLPVVDFPWRRGLEPAERLKALSAWEREYAAAHAMQYVDYYAVLAGADGAFRAGLSVDGVHPTAKGYELMAPVVEKAIEATLDEHGQGR